MLKNAGLARLGSLIALVALLDVPREGCSGCGDDGGHIYNPQPSPASGSVTGDLSNGDMLSCPLDGTGLQIQGESGGRVTDGDDGTVTCGGVQGDGGWTVSGSVARGDATFSFNALFLDGQTQSDTGAVSFAQSREAGTYTSQSGTCTFSASAPISNGLNINLTFSCSDLVSQADPANTCAMTGTLSFFSCG
jgi:hypothetical protein